MMTIVKSMMTITIAGIDFDYHDYDGRGDALYLHLGLPPRPDHPITTGPADASDASED
jgi:hypothetical protein